MRRLLCVLLCLSLLLLALPASAAQLISNNPFAGAVTPYDYTAQDNAKSVGKLLDGLSSTCYSFTGWNSKTSDDVPELTFHFAYTTIGGVWVRSGNQGSSNLYRENARPRVIRLRVVTGKNVYTDYTFELSDSFSPNRTEDGWYKGYQLLALPEAVSNVTRVEMYVSKWRAGTENANNITLSDVAFVSKVSATSKPAATATLRPTAVPVQTIRPTVTSRPTDNDQLGGGLYATLKARMAVRSGPGNRFDSLGSYFSAGQMVEVISAAWDSQSASYWVQVEFTYSGEKRRAYTPISSLNINVTQVPHETLMDTASVVRSVACAYGPGSDYTAYGSRLSIGQQGEVYAHEDGWALFQYYDTVKRSYRRVWVPADALDFSNAHG